MPPAEGTGLLNSLRWEMVDEIEAFSHKCQRDSYNSVIALGDNNDTCSILHAC